MTTSAEILAAIESLLAALENELAVNVQCGQRMRAQRSRKRISHLQQAKHHLRRVTAMDAASYLDRRGAES